jgi:putative ABC transporter type IV
MRRGGRFTIPSKGGRFLAYGLIGWCGEVLFTGIHDFVRLRDRRLPSRTSIWMFPVYGLMAPLYEPLHDRIRGLPAPVRAVAYGAGFLAVEYGTGRLFRLILGQAPWDYSYAKRHVHGLIRPDYFPIWAAAGLAMEPVHDTLVGRSTS